MASLEQMQARVEELTRRHNAAATKQSKLQGALEEKKQELLRLKKEITDAGFDPKTLRDDKLRLETELEQLCSRFETALVDVEKAQEEYEK